MFNNINTIAMNRISVFFSRFKLVLGVLVVAIVFFSSCTSTKKLLKDKTKTKTEEVNSGELSIKRASDTLELTIPKIIYKDTTIYKRGRKSTVYLNYDSQGNAKVISVCDSIQIFKKWYNKVNQEQKNNIRDKDKETVVNDTMILYIFIGLAFLIIVYRITSKFI